MQRGLPAVVLHVHVGVVFDKEFHQLQMPVLRSDMDSGVAIARILRVSNPGLAASVLVCLRARLFDPTGPARLPRKLQAT